MNAKPDPTDCTACALPDTSDTEQEAIADAREAEMDRDPAAMISHEDMMAFIHQRRTVRGSAQQRIEILLDTPITSSLRK